MRYSSAWSAVSWVFMLLMMIGRLLLWGTVIYFGWRYLAGRREGLPASDRLTRREDQSMAVLRQRLAAGDISVDEFDHIAERLTKDGDHKH